MSGELSESELYIFELIKSLENAKMCYSKINSNSKHNLTPEIIHNVETAFKEDIPSQINNIISLINRCDIGIQYQHISNVHEACLTVSSVTFVDAINKVKLETEIKGIRPLNKMELGTKEILNEILFHIKTSVQSLLLTLSLTEM